MQFSPFYKTTLICVALGFLWYANAQDESPSPVFSRRSLNFGAAVLLDARSASIDLSDLQKSVPVDRSPVFSFGLAGGVRLPLTPWLRIELPILLDVGNALDDTLFTAETASVKFYYWHGGIEPRFSLCPWQSQNAAFYFFTGAGANIVYVQERTFYLNNQFQEILYTDRQYIKETSISFSTSAGIGLDIALGNRIGISVTSCFRYMSPISYSIKQDYLLHPLPYNETRLGNVTWAGLSVRW
jgi:hypothetical protein